MIRTLSLALVLVINAPGVLLAGESPPPTFTKIFAPDTIGPGSVSRLTFTIDNAAGLAVSDLAFVDVLPAGVILATPARPQSTCGGPSPVLSAPDGGGTITYSGGTVGAGSICTVRVDVTSSTPGPHMNVSGDLTSSAGNSGTASADLTVATDRPGFAKSFSPATVFLGGRSTLTFTADNSANPNSAFNLTFVDPLPVGLEVAGPANASTTCTGGIVTAVPGSSTVSYGSGSVAAGASCTASVDVVATGVGPLENSSGELTSFTPSLTVLSSGRANATLTSTVNKIFLTKRFTDDPVPPGGTATLELGIQNLDRVNGATAIAFTDDLDATLSGLVATGLPLADPCGPGSQLTGTGLLTLTGGDLPAEGSCTFSVTLQVPAGATPGVYPNTTSSITADVGGSMEVGDPASDLLFVEPIPILTKAFLDATTLLPDPVVAAGDDVVMRFTVTNSSATSAATAITFLDPLTTFLPFPISAVLPATPCGAGSSVALLGCGTDCQSLFLTAGNVPAAGTCSFDVTLSLPVGLATNTYENVTDPISATVDGATVVGRPASDSFDLVAAPRLTKEFTDDPVAPGDTVTLELTLEHDPSAPGDATGITFTDNLASTLTGLAATGLPLADLCGPGNGTLAGSAGDTLLTFSGGTLTPGEVCTFSVTLQVPMGATSGSYPNTTSNVMATVLGVATVENGATDDLGIAGITFTKEFIDDPVLPGGTTTLRFTIENTSTSDATGIFFTDNLAAALAGLAATGPLDDPCGAGSSLSGTTFLILAGGHLLVGGSCTFDVTLQVPAAAADDTYANVTSSLTATVGGNAVVFDPATDDLVVDSNLLTFTKTFTDDPVTPGGTVTLEFTVSNLDAGQAATGITFTDDLDAALSGLAAIGLPANDVCGAGSQISGTGLLTLTGGTLPAGGSCTFSVTLAVPAATSLGTVATNTTSTVSGTIGGLPVSGAPASDELLIDFLSFTKVFDGPTTATGTPQLTFTIANLSTTDPVSDLAFSDDLDAVVTGLTATSLPTEPCGLGSAISGPSLLTFTGGTLLPGGSCTFVVDLLVPGTATAGTFPNTTSELFQAGLPAATPATDDLVIEPPPTFAKTFAPDGVGVGLPTTLSFSIDNGASTLGATALDFTDNLPAPVVVATPPGVTNTCGGILTAVAGTGTISLSAGTVGAGTACTVQVNVVSAAPGVFVNTTGDLTSSSGSSGTATDTLTVNPAPGFAKAFSPDPIAVGGTTTLTFTIDNTASTVAATALDFTDALPAAVTIETPANAVNGCGGTLTASAGTGLVDLTGGTVAAMASCTITVDVTSSTPGAHVNTTGNLTSSLGTSGTATDTLTVNPPPGFSKSFAPDGIAVGGTSTLTFTIDNTGSTAAATALAFGDNLPAAVVVATPANAVNGCGGTLTATSGTGVVSLSGGTVAAGATCAVDVDVTSSTPGSHVNTTGDLTSSLGNSGTATDTLSVSPPPAFSKAFAPNPISVGGTSTLTFTIDNSAGPLAATGLDFTDAFPTEIEVAAPPSAGTTCTGGTITAVAGTSVVSYTGGTVSAGASCTVQVDVTSPVFGMHANTTGDLTSSLGNSGTTSDTLDVQDPDPPEVTALATPAGPLATCDTVRIPVTRLEVTIEDALSPVLGADDPANYLVVAAGPDGDFATAACGGAAGDDIPIEIVSLELVGADPLAVDVELRLPGSNGLEPGLYRFFACDTITDTAGNALDGDGNGTPGPDFVLPFFRADPFNLLENGHFDDCPVTLDPWIAAATAPNSVVPGSPGADDVAASPLSASAQIAHSADAASSLAQCVPVDQGSPYDLSARFRFDPPMGALGLLQETCEFFVGPACSGASLGGSSTATILEDEGGVWALIASEVPSPAGAVSALCDFTVEPVGVDPNFDLFLDALFFGTGPGPIFTDGFESGDTSAWSNAVP